MNAKLGIALVGCIGCAVIATATEWTARSVSIAQVTRNAEGAVVSVDLAFGADNGLENRLYVAYGSQEGGKRISSWEHWQLVGRVGPGTDALTVNVPNCRYCKFFLDVPFGDGVIGEPVSCIVVDGSQYLNTGLRLVGGDIVTCRFRPGSGFYCVLGSRYALNEENVGIAFTSLNNQNIFTFDYNSNPAVADNYASYRLTSTYKYVNTWYDLTLSAAKREVANQFSTNVNATVCADSFTCRNDCYLFAMSGSPATLAYAVGAMSSFVVWRGGECVADYIPYRFGADYGFFDRVGGTFRQATSGVFGGEEDASLDTPLTASTETVRNLSEGVARTIESVLVDDGVLRLSFGADNGYDNRLYLAFGSRDGGAVLGQWENVEYLGVVDGATNEWAVAVPAEGKRCRFFLMLPCEGNEPLVPLKAVVGNGSGYFNTGVKMRGGDVIRARISPAGGAVGSIFGCRSSSDGNDRNIVGVILDSNSVILDYTNSDVLGHRLVSSALTAGSWYDLLSSPAVRSVAAYPSGDSMGANTTLSGGDFETAGPCYLFDTSVNSTTGERRFVGSMALFRLQRDGLNVLSYQACQIGSRVGFYDRITGGFVEPAQGTFVGVVEDSQTSPLQTVSDVVKINPTGIVILFR